MPMLETPIATIAYDERGDPGGDPVVLLASGAHDRHDYDELRDLFPESLRTIALDWPGHGESPAPDAPTSAMSFADVAEAAVEQLAPGGAVVMGNSVGGFSAARLAIRRPELVRGLVIVDGGGFAGRPPHVRAFCALMSRPGFLRRIYPAFSTLYMRQRTAADRRARDAGVATTRAEPGLSVVAGLWRSFASPEHDLRAQAGSISAPTLLIWGRRDPVIPVRFGRRAAAIIPGARLVEFDTGHVPHTSDPEGVARELIPFAEAAVAAMSATADATPAAATPAAACPAAAVSAAAPPAAT
jgi:pimeloyl-ACP methyl ester carboxylesterase